MNKESSALITLFLDFDEIDDSGRLSSLVRSYAVVNYTYKVKQFCIFKGIKDLLSLARETVKSLFSKQKSIELLPELPLLTFMSKRIHLFRMNDLLAKELKENCTRAFFYKTKVESDCNAIMLQRYSHNPLPLFKKHYRSMIGQASKCFINFLKAANLPLSHWLPFMVHLIRQFAAYYTYSKLFQRVKVPYLVCEYDQYNEIAAMVFAAREQGIPTYTQTHGLLNTKFAYTPLIAENIFVWGPYHKRKLRTWGVSKENIFVAGAVQFQKADPLIKERSEILAQMGLKERVLTVATNPMLSDIQGALIEYVRSLLALLPLGWSVVLRPHPSENKQIYIDSLGNSPEIKVFNNQDLALNALLGISDLVTVWNSAFAIDALINQINTVHIALNQIPSEGEVIRLVEEKLMPSFESPEKLVAYVLKLDHSGDEKLTLCENSYSRFQKEYCIAQGDDAVKNMLDNLMICSGK